MVEGKRQADDSALNWIRDALNLARMKITLEMVLAGSAELAVRDEDDTDEVCQDVFVAMLKAAGIQLPIVRFPLEEVSAYRSTPRLQEPQKAQPLDGPSVSFLVDEMESVAIDLSSLQGERHHRPGL
jgi:choline-glycine betaine transporter